MLIDWFTVGAQVLNFLVLVWLMKRYLYKPILHAIDAREERIAAELSDADAQKADAQKERDTFQQKNAAFDQQRSALMTQAKEEAKTERQRLLDEARESAEDLKIKQMDVFRNDAQTLNQALARHVQQEVFDISRKVLKDLATANLEASLCEVFTQRLRELDGPAKAGLAAAFKNASDPALVRSAFDLPEEQRAAIQNALNETFSTEVRIRFETAPDVVSGIELTTNGQKVAWSIAEYLTSLEKGVADLLKKKVESRPKAPESQVVSEPKAPELKAVSKPATAKPKATAKPETSEPELPPQAEPVKPAAKH